MKKLVAMVLALAMVLSLAACGNKAEESTALTEDGLYPSITSAVSLTVDDLMPTNGNSNPKYGFYLNIYESLFDYNVNQEMVPDLGKSLEYVDDTHWRVTLFSDIYDTEGNHITASDVVFSVNWLIGAGEALNYDLFESVEALDEYTVEFTWKAKPTALSDVEFPLVRTFIFSEQAFDETKFATSPVTTGNYKVKEFVTGSKLVLEANPDYWAAKSSEDTSMRLALHNARVREISYEIISEAATAQISLKTGTINYCDYIRASSLSEFENDDKYVVTTNCSSNYSFMAFNMDPSNLLSNDLNLRLAIAYALDSDKIAEAIPGNFTAMKTYGTPYFSDFDPEWENDSNYSNTSDTEKAKEYLAASGYAAAGSPTLTIMCKSSEEDRNAVQMMMVQLQNIGINAKMAAVDSTTFQTDTGVYSNFDMVFFSSMGGNTLASSWKLVCSNVGSARSDGEKNGTLAFCNDEELFRLYAVATADATHNSENMKAVIDYVYENAIVYPVCYSITARVYSAGVISDLYLREGNVTLAASTYAGQEPNVDPAYTGYVLPVAETKADPTLAGTYTYSEAGSFGDKDNDFTLILNADGTYRLECNNCVGENIYTEGTWIVDEAGYVVCSASPVYGDMDKFLNSGWADSDNPAPSFNVHPDGTMTPVMDLSGTYTYSEPGDFGDKDNDFTLILNADGTYRLECNNCVGENIYTEGTWSIDGDGNVACSASPVYGDMDKFLTSGWADTDNPAPVFSVSDDGTMVPAGVEASAEKSDEEPGQAPAEEAGAEPAILSALTGGGFDRFDWTEESSFGTFPWHLMIKNGDNAADGTEQGEAILVVENPNLNTQDGLLVYHCTFTKSGPTLTLSEPDESDEEMKRLGDMWNSDGTSVWTISGAGAVAPEKADH
ncbi:MAG: ABC transporter substrate-binding protein [Faecousia sp.]